MEAKLEAVKREARENATSTKTDSAGTDLLAVTELSTGTDSASSSSASNYLKKYAPAYSKYVKMPNDSGSKQAGGSDWKKYEKGTSGTALLAQTEPTTETDSQVKDLEGK